MQNKATSYNNIIYPRFPHVFLEQFRENIKNCHILILTKKEVFFSKDTNYYTLPIDAEKHTRLYVCCFPNKRSILFFLADATCKLIRTDNKSAVSHDFSSLKIPLIYCVCILKSFISDILALCMLFRIIILINFFSNYCLFFFRYLIRKIKFTVLY